MGLFNKSSKKIKFKKIYNSNILTAFAAVFAVIGIVALFSTFAVPALNGKSAEGESGTSTLNTAVVADATASGGSYLELRSQTPTSECPTSRVITMGTCLNPLSYPSPAVGFSTARIVQETGYAPNYADGVGAFRTECTLSHTSKNDPIVYPGQRDAAHWHQFFGNTAADENFSNAESRGDSTCQGGTLNRTSYWAPALIDTSSYNESTRSFDLAPVMTVSDTAQFSNPQSGGGNALQIYYKAGYQGVDSRTIRWFPPGLKMIAGANPNVAPTGPPPSPIARNPGFKPVIFDCISWGHAQSFWGTRGVDHDIDRIPANCPPGYYIQASVVFPQCGAVDQQGNPVLDSLNHRDHMSYPLGWPDLGCPSTHPIAYPEILEHFRWRVPANGAAGLRFSSDMYESSGSQPGWTFHADWWNGWDANIASSLITNCFHGTIDGSPPGIDCRMNLTGTRHPNGGWWRLD